MNKAKDGWVDCITTSVCLHSASGSHQLIKLNKNLKMGKSILRKRPNIIMKKKKKKSRIIR